MSIPRPLDSTTDFAGSTDHEGAYQHAMSEGPRAAHNEELINTTVTFANSAAQGNTQTTTLAIGSVDRHIGRGRRLKVIVRNPSSQSALDCAVQIQYSDGGTTRYATEGAFTAGLSNGDGQGFTVDGGICGAGLRISCSLVVALNGSGGFSARIVVLHV